MRHDPIDPARCTAVECAPAAMTDAIVREFIPVLDALERDARHTIETAQIELDTLEAREPGDFEDRGTRDAALTLAGELLARGRKELEEVMDTRGRIAAHMFGTCERCYAAIPLFRLRTLPTTRLCVSCQASVETHATPR